MGFPERLKELREARNLSQEELADKLNIPRSSVSHYERPQKDKEIRLPRRERLEKIADFFGVSVDNLLGREEKSEQQSKNTTNNLDELKEEEFRKWLDIYRSSSPEEREAIIRQAQLTLEIIRRDTRHT
jgi:transcriptional regulator with XRE-family HTH domain